jgi:hypothetical protein
LRLNPGKTQLHRSYKEWEKHIQRALNRIRDLVDFCYTDEKIETDKKRWRDIEAAREKDRKINRCTEKTSMRLTSNITWKIILTTEGLMPDT